MGSRCFFVLVAAVVAITFADSTAAEPLPNRLEGSWHITRILPTSNTACWSQEQAEPLVGSRLIYSTNTMSWQGGEVALSDIATRTVTASEFRHENPGADGAAASFKQLGIESASVTEVDMQHEDADITGATTEVPGDSVLMAGTGRIVVSACGVYFEAVRDHAVEHAALKQSR